MSRLTLNEVSSRVANLVSYIYRQFPQHNSLKVYTLPKQPHTALAVVTSLKENLDVEFVDSPADADVIVLNVIHSEEQVAAYKKLCVALVDMRIERKYADEVPSFPWEQSVTFHSGFMAIESSEGPAYGKEAWRHAVPLFIRPTRRQAEDDLIALRRTEPRLNVRNSRCYAMQHFVKVDNKLYRINATPVKIEMSNVILAGNFNHQK